MTAAWVVAVAIMAAGTLTVWLDERQRGRVRHAQPAPWRRAAAATTGWARAHHTEPLPGLPAMDGDYDTTTILVLERMRHELNAAPRPQLTGILRVTPGQLATAILAVRAFAWQVEVAATRPWADETGTFPAIAAGWAA